ncbi:urea ABC transporter permease, partial [Pseudomonas oryzihabitans]
MSLRLFLLPLLLLLAGTVQAGPAADLAAASTSDQAKLLQDWAAAPEPAQLPVLQALQDGRFYVDDAKRPFYKTGDSYTAAEGEAADPTGTPKPVRLNNRLRILIGAAQASAQLLSSDATQRLAA